MISRIIVRCSYVMIIYMRMEAADREKGAVFNVY